MSNAIATGSLAERIKRLNAPRDGAGEKKAHAPLAPGELRKRRENFEREGEEALIPKSSFGLGLPSTTSRTGLDRYRVASTPHQYVPFSTAVTVNRSVSAAPVSFKSPGSESGHPKSKFEALSLAEKPPVDKECADAVEITFTGQAVSAGGPTQEADRRQGEATEAAAFLDVADQQESKSTSAAEAVRDSANKVCEPEVPRISDAFHEIGEPSKTHQALTRTELDLAFDGSRAVQSVKHDLSLDPQANAASAVALNIREPAHQIQATIGPNISSVPSHSSSPANSPVKSRRTSIIPDPPLTPRLEHEEIDLADTSLGSQTSDTSLGSQTSDATPTLDQDAILSSAAQESVQPDSLLSGDDEKEDVADLHHRSNRTVHSSASGGQEDMECETDDGEPVVRCSACGTNVPLFALGEHECQYAGDNGRKPKALGSRPLPQDLPREEPDVEISPTLPQPPVSPLPEDVPEAERQPLSPTSAGFNLPSPSALPQGGLRRRLSSRLHNEVESASVQVHGGSVSSSVSTTHSRHKTLAEMEQDEEPESGYITLLK